jgi:hypothetical protein
MDQSKSKQGIGLEVEVYRKQKCNQSIVSGLPVAQKVAGRCKFTCCRRPAFQSTKQAAMCMCTRFFSLPNTETVVSSHHGPLHDCCDLPIKLLSGGDVRHVDLHAWEVLTTLLFSTTRSFSTALSKSLFN